MKVYNMEEMIIQRTFIVIPEQTDRDACFSHTYLPARRDE